MGGTDINDAATVKRAAIAAILLQSRAANGNCIYTKERLRPSFFTIAAARRAAGRDRWEIPAYCVSS